MLEDGRGGYLWALTALQGCELLHLGPVEVDLRKQTPDATNKCH